MEILDKIRKTIIEGRRKEITSLIEQALAQDVEPLTIIDESMAPALSWVGDRFSTGELFLPDLLLAAKAMKTGLAILQPILAQKGEERAQAGVVVIGTIGGDVHDIGKNLVITMLEGAGYKVVDLGVDNEPEAFVEATRQHKPDVVGFSGLLTTTLAGIPNQVKALEEAGLRDQVILIVGGAPVTQDFADRNGIELYAPDASEAVKVINAALAEHRAA
jgi:corrinoid protein of di/trimethylamine methyltransferase